MTTANTGQWSNAPLPGSSPATTAASATAVLNATASGSPPASPPSTSDDSSTSGSTTVPPAGPPPERARPDSPNRDHGQEPRPSRARWAGPLHAHNSPRTPSDPRQPRSDLLSSLLGAHRWSVASESRQCSPGAELTCWAPGESAGRAQAQHPCLHGSAIHQPR